MHIAKRRRLRELSLGLGALIAAVLVVVVIVWVNIDFLETADRNDAEAREELALGETLRDATADQENALSGLISTRDPRFIEPYEEGRERLEGALGRLTAHSATDTPSQRRDVAEIALLARRWAASFAEPQVVAVKSGRLLPARLGAGKREMAKIREAIENLRAAETHQLQERNEAQAAAYISARVALVVGAAAALAFAILIISVAARQLVNERRLAEKAAEQLREALERAQAAERAKTRFLANMSHEMRTPLNGVCGMTDALTRTPLDPLQRELADAIQFSSRTLDQLIGDLLSLSRDGAAVSAEHAVTAFQLGATVRAAAKPFAMQAQEKGLGFVVEVDSDADARVVGDASKLGQLLAGLLSNAVKFTDRGQVRLSVLSLGQNRYAFEVADTGLGFDEAQKARMFETFSQSDDSDTRRHGGAGLGLALALRRVAELGGRLDARSTPGEGAVFSFEIGLSAAQAETAAPLAGSTQPHDEAEPDGDDFRVLIVDDNSTNRKVLELILDQVGARWVSVENGLQAVEAASGQAFSAILMDIQMPVMDGLTATKEIRRLEHETGRPFVPVIFVSANCQPEHVQAGQAVGGQRHLGKPVSAPALIDALNAVLDELSHAA